MYILYNPFGMNFQSYKKEKKTLVFGCMLQYTHIPQARTLEKHLSTLNMRRQRSRTSAVLFISSIVIVHAYKTGIELRFYIDMYKHQRL